MAMDRVGSTIPNFDAKGTHNQLRRKFRARLWARYRDSTILRQFHFYGASVVQYNIS